jgi:hypothetical protein
MDLRLVHSVEKNAYHYIEFFSRAVDKILPEPTVELTYVVALRRMNSASNAVTQVQG